MLNKPSYDELKTTVHQLKDELERIISFNKEQAQNRIELQKILDGIPYNVFWKDLDSTYMGCNISFAKFAGIDNPNSIIGLTEFDLAWKEEDAKKYIETDKRIIKTNTPEYHRVELEYHSENKYSWFDITKVPMHDSDGNVIGILGIFEDITERKETELKLIESEDRFRTLVSNIPGVIYRCLNDEYWTMIYISDTIEEITHYPASDFINNKVRSFNSIMNPSDSLVASQNVELALSKKGPFIIEYRILDSKGDIKWVYEKGQGVFDDKGNLKWLDGAIFDITEQKRLEQVKDDVERMMRHDLKSPLNSIINAPQLVKEYGPLNEEQKQLIDIIELSSKHMLDMINLSLDIYKMETGKYIFKPEKIDIINVLKRVIEDLRSEINPRGINVNVFLNGSALNENDTLYCMGEELLCYPMLANLTKNAVESSNLRDVTIDLRKEDDIEISIHNHNIVPKAIKDHFFEKYSTYGKGNVGTGLGTYSARLFAKTQGGKIEMETGEEKGTIVTIFLSRA